MLQSFEQCCFSCTYKYIYTIDSNHLRGIAMSSVHGEMFDAFFLSWIPTIVGNFKLKTRGKGQDIGYKIPNIM